MTDGKMATQASQLIGFKQALSAFSQAMGKYGGATSQILFVGYPDGTIAPKLNGKIDPHQILAAIKFLTQLADEQVAEMNMQINKSSARNGVMPNGNT